MTFTELQAAVKVRIGAPADDGFFTATVLGDVVNEALQAISTENDWPWLLTSENLSTVAGTSTLTPGATWIRTKSLQIAGFDPFEWFPIQDLDGLVGQGQPTIFAEEGNTLQIRAIPDAVYSIKHRFWRTEPVLTSGSVSPLMPTNFHYSIVAFAAYLAHNRAHELDRANQELNSYRMWLERMQSYRRKSAGPIRPRVRPGGGL